MIREKIQSLTRKLRKNYPLIVLSLAVLALIIIFVVRHVSLEQFIYFYDYATYHNLYEELGDKFLHQPLKALDSISVSVRKAEYNNSGVIALVPFYFVFGADRIGYISAIAIVYAFPIILFFPFLIRKIIDFDDCDDLAEKTMFFAAAVILLGLLPQFWIPTLLGYIDVAGVGLIFAILYLYFRRKLHEQNVKQLIVLGLLLSATVILRRWYAYWVVGFFAAAAVCEFWDFLRGGRNFGELKKSFFGILIIGSASVLSFFALSSKIAATMLTTDYRDAYSAFRSNENVFQALGQLCSYFGWIFTLSAAFGWILMFIRKDLRRRGLFLTILFAVPFYLFTRTQDIGRHHYYWVISILIIFSAVTVFEIYRKLEKNWQKYAFLICLMLISSINFSIVFFPSAENILEPVSFSLPTIRSYPMVRSDFEQVHQLLSTLNSLTENSGAKIYVLSSSINSNGGVIYGAADRFEPELKNLKNRLLQTFDVDRRDGFPFQLYEAEYVLIAEPVGGTLPSDDEKIVIIPAKQILNSEGIGAAYVKLPYSFDLEGGEKVYIFHRQRKFTRDELKKMSDTFVDFYPEHHSKFEIDDEKLNKYSEN